MRGARIVKRRGLAIHNVYGVDVLISKLLTFGNECILIHRRALLRHYSQRYSMRINEDGAAAELLCCAGHLCFSHSRGYGPRHIVLTQRQG